MSEDKTYTPKNAIKKVIKEMRSVISRKFTEATLTEYNPLSNAFVTGKVLKQVLDSLPTPITPKGSILFTNLPSVDETDVGDMYNIKDGFISTAEFEGGADVAYEAGTNVVCCKYGGVKKWDAFSTPITYVTDSAPIGAITAFAGTTVPVGYLLCDGSEKKIASYPALAAVLGTSFGTASDSDYFVLPDLREAVPKGAGLTGKTVGEHVSTNGLAVGEFLDDRLQKVITNADGITNTNSYIPVNANVALLSPGSAGYYVGSLRGTMHAYRSGDTTEVKSVGVNYIIKAK